MSRSKSKGIKRKHKRTTKPGEVKIRRCRLCSERLKSNWLYCDRCKKIIHAENIYSDPFSEFDLNYNE